MKKIKRCIAIILSMVLGFSMSTVSFASERYNQNDNSKGTCSTVSVWIVFCKYRSHRILSPYHSINHQIQKSEAFQSVHHVTFILCYTVLYDFLALVFALIRIRKH